MGLVLNEARSITTMAGAAEEALRQVKGVHYLGHLGLRQAFVEAFAAGVAVHSGSAAVYAVNAMASVAAIPMIGWAMAPEVGELAYAAGLGYAGLASAAGGWDRVPSDQLAMIHKDEKVLPASVANAERKFFEGGKGGGATEIHIHTVDTHSFERMLLRNQGALLKVTNTMASNGRKR